MDGETEAKAMEFLTFLMQLGMLTECGASRQCCLCVIDCSLSSRGVRFVKGKGFCVIIEEGNGFKCQRLGKPLSSLLWQ